MNDHQKFLQREQEKWERIVLQSVVEQADAHPYLQQMMKAVIGDAGDDATAADALLEAKAISNGNLNFSFKISPKKNCQPTEFAVYAKLSLSFALWNPDPMPVDLDRTLVEFEMLRKFQAMMGDNDDNPKHKAPVATPYYCNLVKDHEGNTARLMVTEWSPYANQQWAYQCALEEMDPTLTRRVAKAFATLNLSTDFTPTLNEGMRNYIKNIAPGIIAAIQSMCGEEETPDEKDRCVQYIQKLGTSKVCDLIDKIAEESTRQQVLSHNDGHVFNILVEPSQKPANNESGGDGTVGTPSSSSSTPDFLICDWELASGGSVGRDPGIFYFYPVACALYQAATGHADKASRTLDTLENVFWETYADCLATKGHKNEEYVTAVYRDSLGWAAYYLLGAVYVYKLFLGPMETDLMTEEQKQDMMARIGMVGVQFFEFSAAGDQGQDLSLSELRKAIRKLVETHVKELSTS